MSKENLAQTLDELLAFVEARLVKRTLPDGRQLVWDQTRRLTAEEMDRLFVLDQTAGLQANACGLGLPALPARVSARQSHLPYSHLPYVYGPGMTLRPTRVWFAEIRAIRAAAGPCGRNGCRKRTGCPRSRPSIKRIEKAWRSHCPRFRSGGMQGNGA